MGKIILLNFLCLLLISCDSNTNKMGHLQVIEDPKKDIQFVRFDGISDDELFIYGKNGVIIGSHSIMGSNQGSLHLVANKIIIEEGGIIKGKNVTLEIDDLVDLKSFIDCQQECLIFTNTPKHLVTFAGNEKFTIFSMEDKKRRSIPFSGRGDLENDSNLSCFAIEHYCENPQCPKYRHIKSLRHEAGFNEVLTRKNIDFGLCKECGQSETTRFAFYNCRYQIVGEKSKVGTIITYPINESRNEVNYFFPYKNSKYEWDKFRIKTGDLFKDADPI